MNPSGTASAGVGFGETKGPPVQYISMADIESGKVQIPGGKLIPPPDVQS